MRLTELLHVLPMTKTILFGVLAQSVDYPDEGLVESIFDSSWTTEMGQALAALGHQEFETRLKDMENYFINSEDRKKCLLELQKEYTRLCFVSKPRQVRLFESVCREGKLFQETTFDIARLYYDAGLELKQQFDLPPDHIAAELEFMAYLCFQEAKQREDDDSSKVEYSRELQQKVLIDHLGFFAGNFAVELKTHAQSGFYGLVADILLTLFGGYQEKPKKEQNLN